MQLELRLQLRNVLERLVRTVVGDMTRFGVFTNVRRLYDGSHLSLEEVSSLSVSAGPW